LTAYDPQPFVEQRRGPVLFGGSGFGALSLASARRAARAQGMQ